MDLALRPKVNIAFKKLRRPILKSKLLRMMTRSALNKLLVSIAATVLAASGVYAQRVDPASVKINNLIGLNSTYAQVVKAFGKPRRETRPVKEECAGGHEKTINYAGLSFYFMDAADPSKTAYIVMSFELTSPRFSVSGLKVGDSEAAVRLRFGKPTSVETNRSAGQTTWTYEIGKKEGPGQTAITFKKGRVIAIGSSYAAC